MISQSPWWLIAGGLLLAPVAGGLEAWRNEKPLVPTSSVYQQIIDSAVARGVPGVQAVVMAGSTEWSGAAGVASVEQRTRMAADHRIRTASITKMMTYAVIMELARQKRIALSDRAVTRLPRGILAGIPYADSVTIEQLLEHTSGLHNFNGRNGHDFVADLYRAGSRPRIRGAAELIAYARKPSNPPTGKPGESRSYSSTGYIVLEMIAEHVTSTPLPKLYRQLIFEPLGMTRSGAEGYDLNASDIVDSYARPMDLSGPNPFAKRPVVRADGLVNLSSGLSHYNAWARGAGAVASTAGDLAKFMRAVTANRLIVLRDQAQQFASAQQRATASFNWNGGSAGIQASIFYAPAGDITIIVLMNATGVPAESIAIARELLKSARP